VSTPRRDYARLGGASCYPHAVAAAAELFVDSLCAAKDSTDAIWSSRPHGSQYGRVLVERKEKDVLCNIPTSQAAGVALVWYARFPPERALPRTSDRTVGSLPFGIRW
jgi:hypothetical protein